MHCKDEEFQPDRKELHSLKQLLTYANYKGAKDLPDEFD